MDSEEDRGSEVSQIEDQEDQSLKFDFHVNVFNIKVRLNWAHIRNILNKFHVPGYPDLSYYLLM